MLLLFGTSHDVSLITVMEAFQKLLYFGSLIVMITRLYASDNALVTDVVSFDITIGDEDVGTIDIGLFGDIAPLTVRNFVHYASSQPGYERSTFHRVINDFMVQGGDFVNRNGSGETSIYGGRFADENFTLKHYGAGWLSMANAGPNTNTCQFFITAKGTWWLDDKHVVFGKILRGMKVLRQILNVETDKETNQPKVDVMIAKSRASRPPKSFTVSKDSADWTT